MYTMLMSKEAQHPVHPVSHPPLSHPLLNPLKDLRLQLKLTQDQVARFSNCTRLTVVRAEQGLFEEPPIEIVYTLIAKYLDIPRRGLTEPDPLTNPLLSPTGAVAVEIHRLRRACKVYQKYIRHMNGLNGEGFLQHPFDEALAAVPERGHVFERLRESSGMSQIGFCIKFCVNPGGLHKWESFKQVAMPSQLLDALLDAGYPRTSLEWLAQEASRQYVQHQGIAPT